MPFKNSPDAHVTFPQAPFRPCTSRPISVNINDLVHDWIASFKRPSARSKRSSRLPDWFAHQHRHLLHTCRRYITARQRYRGAICLTDSSQ